MGFDVRSAAIKLKLDRHCRSNAKGSIKCINIPAIDTVIIFEKPYTA